MQRARTDEAKDERRLSILMASLDEFYEKGFAAARMDDIARRAGLSKAAVYLYFKNKDALFTELLREISSPKLDYIDAFFGRDLSFEEAMNQFAEFLPTVILNSPMPKMLKVMIGESGGHPKLMREFRETVLDRVICAVRTFLERAEARGEIQLIDADLTARLILSPMPMNGMWRILFESDAEALFDVSRMFKIHALYMIRALSPSGDLHAS